MAKVVVDGVEYVPVKTEIKCPREKMEKAVEAANALDWGFDWASTREGFKYWEEVCNRLRQIGSDGIIS